MVFPVRSVPRCYRKDSWSNELLVGQSPACKNVGTEAEDIDEIRHQAMTEDKTERDDSARAVVNCTVCELAIAYSYV
jgi:hypothetical protein